MPDRGASRDASLDDWIARDAVGFSLDGREGLNAAVDRLIAALGGSVALLGFGEALHGGEEILLLRNRLFQRLVEAHGYSAIAIESSFPRGRIANDYVAGRRPSDFDAVQETGFSHGFGRLAANRELVEWMRQYNADPAHRVKLRFYGFDSPTEMTTSDSPRQLLHVALDYLASLDCARAEARRQRIDALLGADADWENPAAALDPTQSVGLSPAAAALRIETEELITELRLCVLRAPEATAKRDEHAEAVQHASVARQLLTYHAALAQPSDDRIARLLGIRDLIMADNLAYIVERERGRGGKVLAFAHNTHLQRGEAHWQWGPNLLTWCPAGAHLHQMLTPARYAVIGSAVGASQANGIAPAEAGTLEARLRAAPGPIRFIPTHRARAISAAAIDALPIRSASATNPTYFALAARRLSDFDFLAVLDSVTSSRGGR